MLGALCPECQLAQHRLRAGVHLRELDAIHHLLPALELWEPDDCARWEPEDECDCASCQVEAATAAFRKKEQEEWQAEMERLRSLVS